MKSSEFIDEGIGDWFKAGKNWLHKKGFGTREQQIAAIASADEEERRAQYAAATGMVKQRFANDLQRAIDAAINAGKISLAENVRRVTILNALLESKILTEALNVQQFVSEYMASLLKNYGQIDQENQQLIDQLAADIGNQYRGPGSKFPTANAGKLFDLAMTIKQLQGNREVTTTRGPRADTTFQHDDGIEYTYDTNANTWTDDTGRPVTDKNLIDELNRAYWKEQKRVQASGGQQRPQPKKKRSTSTRRRAGAQSATQSGAQPAAQPAAQSATQSGAQPAAQPAAQSATQSGAQPATQSGAQPATQSGAQPAIWPDDQMMSDWEEALRQEEEAARQARRLAAGADSAKRRAARNGAAAPGSTQPGQTTDTLPALPARTPKVRDPRTGRFISTQPRQPALPAPQQGQGLPAPEPQVGTQSSTGGSTFQSPGTTVHRSATDRETLQKKARAKAEAERQARLAAQAGARTRLPAPRTIQ